MSQDGPLYQKFRVERTDGQSSPGGKHADCRYFVLDLDHGPYAHAACLAYAEACRSTHPVLAQDLRGSLLGPLPV